jgi:mRNA interferase HigB
MMRIIKVKTLKEFWQNHKETEEQLSAWVAFVKKAEWRKPLDVKKQFAKASIIGSNRAVFDICGGNYRLVVKLNYDHHIVFIRFIGTHKEYDTINAGTI